MKAARRLAADFKTLGACADEMLQIVERADRDENTRKAYKNHLDRFRAHWPFGKCNTFPAARVDLDHVMRLRDYLKHRFGLLRLVTVERHCRQRTK